MTTDNRANEPNQNETKSGQTFCFTEAQVEAAAKAVADADNHLWTALADRMREKFRGYARAALVAAAGAAPVQPSSTVDEGDLSEVIEDAIIDNLKPENTITGFYVPFGRVSDIASVAARAVVEAIGGESR